MLRHDAVHYRTTSVSATRYLRQRIGTEYRSLLIFLLGNMLLLCIRSDVMSQTVAVLLRRLSRTSLEDTGGLMLNHFPDRKEANHGGHSSVVDEG